MLRTIIAATLVAFLAALPVAAQDGPAYLDDRSTPERLVLSFYNAINRYEYARAYGYLSPYAAPNYDAWQFHFDDVVSVSVRFGEMALEGAAGAIYYQLPVTLDFIHAEGQQHVERGCISVEWPLPHDAIPPYQPMFISALLLETVDPARPDFAPARCD